MVLDALDHLFSPKNGDSYVLLDGKLLGISNKIENITRFACVSYVYLKTLNLTSGQLRIIY